MQTGQERGQSITNSLMETAQAVYRAFPWPLIKREPRVVEQ